MPATVDQVMTHDPLTLDGDGSIADAARAMRDNDIGAVVVVDRGSVAGLITDRDIVVRGIAEGRDPSSTPVSQICSARVTTITPDQSASDAARVMREHDVRRLPVVQDGRPVGIVSIGDLAISLDDESALADISAASPNR